MFRLLNFLRLYKSYDAGGAAGYHGYVNLPFGLSIFRGLDGQWSRLYRA